MSWSGVFNWLKFDRTPKKKKMSAFCGAIDKWHFSRQMMQCHVEVSANSVYVRSL